MHGFTTLARHRLHLDGFIATFAFLSRIAASESWDDDFLWQHSSSSDLHLPSSASRHHQRNLSHQHQHHRDKRLSTASSSSEYYASTSARIPARPYRKASTLSTSTTRSMTPDEALPSPLPEVGPGSAPRNALSRSASSSYSNRTTASTSSSSGCHTRSHHKNWASLSQTSLQEEGEDEPTITLATIAARHVQSPTLVPVPMSRSTASTSCSSTSPLRSPYSPASTSPIDDQAGK